MCGNPLLTHPDVDEVEAYQVLLLETNQNTDETKMVVIVYLYLIYTSEMRLEYP